MTTTTVADPELVLEHRGMKIFTVLYLLVGIGMAFVAIRMEAPPPRQRGSAPEDEPDLSSSG